MRPEDSRQATPPVQTTAAAVPPSPAAGLSEPQESTYFAARLKARVGLWIGRSRRRRLEDHLARVLPRGLAAEEIRRLATAAALYHAMAEVDGRYRRALRLTGDPITGESATILTLMTPFQELLGFHTELGPHHFVPLPAPRDKSAGAAVAIGETLAGLPSGRSLYFARYSRPSISEEALHLTRLPSIPSEADLTLRLSDLLNLNPAYYHWFWSLELFDGQSS